MWQLRAGLVATSLIFSSAALSDELKITVLYNQPKNAEEFDKYYFGKHMPMVYALNKLKKVEVARAQPALNGAQPPYYIVTELWFESPEEVSGRHPRVESDCCRRGQLRASRHFHRCSFGC